MNTDRTLWPKLGLLRLAEKLGNVTRACQSLGYSRDSYYRFKALYDRGGEDALRNFSRQGPMVKNRVSPEVAARVHQMTFAHPAWGQQRLADALCDMGVKVSSSGVRSIWIRAGLETFEKRVFALMARVDQSGLPLTGEQQAAVDKARTQGRFSSGRFISAPGKLCFLDVTRMGEHPRFGYIYHHTFVDAYSQMTFARLTTEDSASSILGFMSDEVLPWFRSQGVTVEVVKTDRRSPFVDRADAVSFEAFLKHHGIRHTYRLGRAGKDDLCRTLVSAAAREVYQPLFRMGDFDLVEARRKLASWVQSHNISRPAEGPSCYGKTPSQTFRDVMRSSRQNCRIN